VHIWNGQGARPDEMGFDEGEPEIVMRIFLIVERNSVQMLW